MYIYLDEFKQMTDIKLLTFILQNLKPFNCIQK